MTMRRIAVGFFDGVHLGHQAILQGADVALTFKRHPLELLKPDKAPRLMMSLSDRLDAIRAAGVREVLALDFTEELAGLEPEEFAARYLGKLPCTVRCGDNWRFGKGGKGNADFLRSLGYEVAVIPYAEYQGEIISSTRIRAALEAGKIEDANQMLGRAYRVSGEVFSGKGKGKDLGYPTVNIRSAIGLKLPRGVYQVEMDGAKAIANYGFAPTFGARAWTEPVWEIHFLTPTLILRSLGEGGFSSFTVRKFIRPERKFASLEDLQRQIALDCATIGA